jgi:cytochrome o ubiquinol oxidase subunit 3
MTKAKSISHEASPDAHHDPYNTTVFGFWMYLMTDFMMFATFFATYAVLRNGTAGGPASHELFNLPFTLIQTLVLLVSAFTSGLAKIAVHRKDREWTMAWFGLTFLCGAIFMGMELHEMNNLVDAGNGWDRSAFLSAFFTLVGTHWLHVIVGLLWIIVLILPVKRHGVTPVSVRRLTCLSMFWQFINVVWIFIFSIVYLLGGN